MKHSRALKAEVDVWKLAWQEVETFVDRLDSAVDQDASHGKKTDALLAVAAVIEHQRAQRVEEHPTLSDPLIDRATLGFNLISLWSDDYRKFRMPGNDEIEAAVAGLKSADPDLDKVPDEAKELEKRVQLLPRRALFEIRLEQDDVRRERAPDGMFLLKVPSYPAASATAASIVPAMSAGVSIDEDEVKSLFSREARYRATMSSLVVQDSDSEEDDDEPPDLFVKNWTTLCVERRLIRQMALDSEVEYVGPSALPLISPELLSCAQVELAKVNEGTANGLNVVGVLSELRSAANATIGVLGADLGTLQTAVDVIDESGAETEALSGDLAAAVSHLEARVTHCQTVATECATLIANQANWLAAGASERTAMGAPLLQAVINLASTSTLPTLFINDVEFSSVAAELTQEIHQRVAYPDGTLRVLRALEQGLRMVWPSRRRWFRLRYEQLLKRRFERFRRAFNQSLRALIVGGDTGLPIEFSLDAEASVGAMTLTTFPETLQSTLSALECGQVGVLLGDRKTAAVIMGVSLHGGRVELNTLPLRVSIAAGGSLPGSAGIVPAETELSAMAPGLSQTELMRGKHAEGAAGDGLVEQTIALWSGQCLLYGWLDVERQLQANAGLSAQAYSERLVRDPSSAPLEDLVLHGTLPPRTSTFVLKGVGDAYWDHSTSAATPRFARSGEFLLIRGETAAEEGEPAVTVQGVCEVEQVLRISGTEFRQMDLNGVAQLSTTPIVADATCEAGGKYTQMPCGADENLIVITCKRLWLSDELASGISFRRDFEGFDLPSLAAEQLLPGRLMSYVLPTSLSTTLGDVRRDDEFAGALSLLSEYTRFAS